MDVPVGFLKTLWSFLSFLPFFFLIFLLAIFKGAIICPIAGGIIIVGNSALVIGLWPAHYIWTYFCVAKTKRLGWVLKIMLLVCLPLPLILWPVIVIAASILGGIGYGFFAPLLATFESINGGNIADKLLHCFLDGTYATIEGSCTVVRDFTDFCFHSYFSFMDQLREDIPADEKPIDINLLKLPKCLFVALLAVPMDVPIITAIALWKSPYMLFRGWKRLSEDLIGREGPFLETVCVPFAGLAIILWPLAVVGAVLAAFFSSFFLGLYSGVIVHQEDSLRLGLAFIIAVVSLFDEYTNDVLYFREGSCFPRPKYRRNMNHPNSLERSKSYDDNETDQKNVREGSRSTKLVSERSITLKQAIQRYTPVQVWDWLFKSCEVNGRILLRDNLIEVKDINECLAKGNCKKLGIRLPAWTILQCLLGSAKLDSRGLMIYEIQLTTSNWPKDKVFEWFVGPLLIIKDQIKGLKLEPNEEICLRKVIMCCKNEKLEDWDDSGFPSADSVRKAQLQAIVRRLQGIVGHMSRMPTFRRRFRNLVKVLYLEAIQNGLITPNQDGGGTKSRRGGRNFLGRGNKKDTDATAESSNHGTSDNGDIV